MKAKTRIEDNGNDKELEVLRAQARINLLKIKPRLLRVRVRGISPLIQHAWSVKAVKMMEAAQQKKAKKGREPKNPDEEYDGCFYTDEEGRACVPASAFKKAMVAAATAIDDKVNFPKTKIRQCVFVVGSLLPIDSRTGPKRRTDPVRLGGTTADIRYRPEFVDWAIDLTLQYNASVLSSEQVVNLLNLAGFGVGIGEWRPEKDGDFGRFEVETTLPVT